MPPGPNRNSMKRRLLLATGAKITLGTLGCWAFARALAQPTHKVSAGQLQRMLAERFPMRYPVADLFTLDVAAPRLRLLPERNLLSTELPLQAAGPALRRSYSGSVEVEFGLRYEPSDQSIRADRLRAHSFRFPGLSPQALSLLDSYSHALAQQALLEVVLHRLGARELALPEAMGLEPGGITVTADGLSIEFVPKAARPAT